MNTFQTKLEPNMNAYILLIYSMFPPKRQELNGLYKIEGINFLLSSEKVFRKYDFKILYILPLVPMNRS